MHFWHSQGGIFSHVISKHGVATHPSKIIAVAQWLVPTFDTELRSFLGLTRYYRHFIKGHGNICRPFFDLLKKKSFSLSANHLAIFEKLKPHLITAHVLALW
jgi:hypothetical protein